MPLHSGRRIRFARDIYDTPSRKRYRRIKFLTQMGYTVGRAALEDAKKFPLPNYGDAGAALVSGAIHKLSGSGSSDKMPNLRSEMDIEKTPQGTKRTMAVWEQTASDKKASGTSSSNMSTLTTKSCSNALKAITNMAELDSHKRSTPARYRLHSAKYLKMDAMLKELMFPLHRFKGFFGFMSTSGNGMDVSVQMESDKVGQLAPRSAFRGISFFKLRHCAPRDGSGYPSSSADDQAKLLNASRVKIGSTNRNTAGTSEDIYTYFRRFNNTPVIIGTGTGAAAPPATSAAGVMTMSTAPGNYRQLWMDFNTADIVRASMQEANFLPNITASTSQGGGGSGGTDPWTIPSEGPNPFSADISDGVVNIKPSLKDAVVRIADGKVVMDITNGQRIPTVVEIVIHSMKKQQARGLEPTSHSRTQDIYEAIWKAANYQKSEKTNYVPSSTASTGTDQGGWNTFWDPKTPFLKVKGPGKKMVEDIANEVHRSVHYLAPGESKTIDIALGSLYYKLGHRSANFGGASDGLSPQTLIDAAGTLAVAVGHFGIDQLETCFSDNHPFRLNQAGAAVAPDATLGAGFWVGKRPAPSQIVVSGSYEESWYPSYMNREGRYIASQSALASHLDEYTSVGLGSVPPTQVIAMNDTQYYSSVGAGKTNQAYQST